MVDDAFFSRICVVLVETSHPGNVGAVARAMKTMGFHDLRLVRPRFADVIAHEDAVAFASGAQDVLEASKVFTSLPDALHDVGLAFALSARQRTLAPVVLQSPEQAAAQALQELLLQQDAAVGLPKEELISKLAGQEGGRVAFVFGSERVGLSNADVLLCQAQVTIPCNPNYSSLNLAQAVQVICYALRCEAMASVALAFDLAGGHELLPAKNSGSPAFVSVQAVESLHAHWLEAMEAVGFFTAKKSNKLALRLSRLLAKVPFEKEEIDLVRGFLREVVNVGKGGQRKD